MITRSTWAAICGIVAIVSAGGVCYYLATDTIPIILCFIPFGDIERDRQPILYWLIVAVHILLTGVAVIVGLWLTFRGKKGAESADSSAPESK